MYDEQLKHYYSDLIRVENISRYKSNKHWTDDSWRYVIDEINKKDYYWSKKELLNNITNVKLEYRIIVEGYSNFDSSGRLTDKCYDFLSDTIKIGQCLGFDVDTSYLPDIWNTSKYDWSNTDILLKNGDVFANVKLYKNGNRHVKFHKDVIKKLNVEAGRLFGWIRSKEEAMTEFDINENEIEKIWQSNKQIKLEDCRNVLQIGVHNDN